MRQQIVIVPGPGKRNSLKLLLGFFRGIALGRWWRLSFACWPQRVDQYFVLSVGSGQIEWPSRVNWPWIKRESSDSMCVVTIWKSRLRRST
jgi:hypothetical protein